MSVRPLKAAIIGELDKQGRNDRGELVGFSSLLIWFRDGLVCQSGKHRKEGKANT